MSNIFYSTQVQDQEQTGLVINSNQLILQKMEERQKAMEQEAMRRAALERANTFEPLIDEDGNPVLDENGDPVAREGEPFAEPDSSVYAAETIRAAEEQAEAILTQAREEAEAIRNSAEAEAVAKRNKGYEDGRQEGYADGMRDANQDLISQREDLEQERSEFRYEYEKQLEAMESALIDKITDVIDHVFHSEISGKKDIIFHLMEMALSNASSSLEFQIRLNRENAAHFLEKKQDILMKLPEGVQLDLIEDPLLSETDCTIETDGGIFDCSVDTEFENLMKDVRALSRGM